MAEETPLPQDLLARAEELALRRPNETILARMTADAFEASAIDPNTLALIWLAALVALDAPVESFLMNLGAASENGISLEQVHRVLAALSPIVGSARAISATSKIAEVLKTWG
jgi:alkylhydroperoxidase/carboxymuconolactone decarboxylase family protein YurZ